MSGRKKPTVTPHREKRRSDEGKTALGVQRKSEKNLGRTDIMKNPKRVIFSGSSTESPPRSRQRGCNWGKPRSGGKEDAGFPPLRKVSRIVVTENPRPRNSVASNVFPLDRFNREGGRGASPEGGKAPVETLGSQLLTKRRSKKPQLENGKKGRWDRSIRVR